MITDAWLNFVATVLQSAYNALPPWTPTVNATGVSNTHAWLNQYNQVAPVAEMETVVALFVTVFLLLGGFMFVKFIINVIRGAGA